MEGFGIVGFVVIMYFALFMGWAYLDSSPDDDISDRYEKFK
jgi:hypothetical protein